MSDSVFRRSAPGAGALIVSVAALALAAPAVAQTWTAPAPNQEVQAALAKADAGDPAPLVALADAGGADAEYYTGVMYIFGRGSIAKDPARGCVYEQKASVVRADAMHLVGMCYQSGAGGGRDVAKAEAAFSRAAEMGFPKSKCALGQMLMAQPGEAERGLALCEEAASAGDADAQVAVGNAYLAGTAVTRDPAQARKWYEMAVGEKPRNVARVLGEMYAKGDGGPKDTKRAVELWQAAEKAGDPMAAILVADQLFSDLTGGRTPGPGKYAFRGGVPVADIEAIETWYRAAETQDPRPDVKQRAKYALAILQSIKQAAPQAR